MLYNVEAHRYWSHPLYPECTDRPANDNPPAPPSDEKLIAEAMRVFRIVAQEFYYVPDEDKADEESGRTTYGLKTYMELFADQVSKRMFGKTWPKALAYLTAHKLKLMGLEDPNAGMDEEGNITDTDDGLGKLSLALRLSSASEGETSVSFRSLGTSGDGSSSVDGDYELTQYGIEFLKLRKNCVVGIISAGEPEYQNGRRM